MGSARQLLLSLLFFSCVSALLAEDTDAPLSVSFLDSSTREVRLDSPLTFTCNINRDMLFVVQNEVNMVMKPVHGEAITLSTSARLVNGEPDFYKITIVNSPSGHIQIKFDILKVRDINDGKLICRVNSTKKVVEAEVDIVVLRPIENFKLKVKEVELKRSTTEPLALDLGRLVVTCTAEGSNPKTEDVKILFHGEKITATSDYIEMGGLVRKWRTFLNATIQLDSESSGKTVECVAVPKIGSRLDIAVPIKINIFEPNVNCFPAQASLGQSNTELKCVVQHIGPKVRSYRYELGFGDSARKLPEPTLKEINDTVTEVTTVLEQVDSDHFKGSIYLIMTHIDDHVSKEKVELIFSPDDSANSPNPLSRPDENGENKSSQVQISLVSLVLLLIGSLLL
ncbi:uncharacterized protein LOC131940836 isoform X1 [Physella acuta]|uniref:uncharacterized protein LOC131940836 isoform X1 n=1 Tax=Physella acuta TaxID=109671 RepID=UPI0027DE308B|nr:uncharacterized protein LOC131940836 isoform X1 [Physella acuta]